MGQIEIMECSRSAGKVVRVEEFGVSFSFCKVPSLSCDINEGRSRSRGEPNRSSEEFRRSFSCLTTSTSQKSL
jgi:hypothetical protein